MTRPPKPTALKPILENVPAELRDIPRWICWKIAWHKKRQKWVKLPINPHTGRAASSTDPTTWTDFETAAAGYELLGMGDGVGFIFTGDDGVTGLDFDHSFDPASGEISGPVREVLDTPGFWEISPSGDGLHCFTRSQLDCAYTDKPKGIEIYPHERFFTVTGHAIASSTRVPDAPVDLSTFLEKHFPDRKKPAAQKTDVAVSPLDGPDFFRRVNDTALKNLGSWFPVLFPEATESNKGYRVASATLGRDLEEDISATPEGIKDFGVHDMGDDREGKRTPIDLLIEWHHVQFNGGDEDLRISVMDAARWLCSTMGVDPVDLGWQAPTKPNADPETLALNFDTDDDGRPIATVSNVLVALRNEQYIGARIGLDAFRDELMIAPVDTEEWRAFTDADYVRLRWVLELKGFKPVGRELIRDTVCLVAEEHKFDSAIIWLESQQWDGVPRIEKFFSDYMGAEDNEYTRACSLYVWSALAGRVMSPGCKADMAPVLIGAQGIGKSTGVAALVPTSDQFCEISLVDREDDLARKMRGRLVGEIGELRGLHSRELEAIKQFMSRTHEDWTPKYKEFNTKYPRRLVFWGTTNAEEFLADETGNRRWLPIRVSRIDVSRIRADVLQLWAEARDLFALCGVLYADAEKLAAAVHAEHMIRDPWERRIEEWLSEKESDKEVGVSDRPRRARPFTMAELLEGALSFKTSQITRKEEMRAARVCNHLGLKRWLRRVDGEPRKIWIDAEAEAEWDEKERL